FVPTGVIDPRAPGSGSDRMGWVILEAWQRGAEAWPRRIAGALVVAALVATGLSGIGPASAEPRLIVTQDADYRGFDYRTEKNVTLDACNAACLGDMQCRALTYNGAAGWCFLKSDFGALSGAPG